MKALILSIGLFTLVGCAGLPAILGGSSNDIKAFLTAQVAGTYTVTIQKDGNTILTKIVECTKDAAGKLTGCHDRETGSVSPL